MAEQWREADGILHGHTAGIAAFGWLEPFENDEQASDTEVYGEQPAAHSMSGKLVVTTQPVAQHTNCMFFDLAAESKMDENDPEEAEAQSKQLKHDILFVYDCLGGKLQKMKKDMKAAMKKGMRQQKVFPTAAVKKDMKAGMGMKLQILVQTAAMKKGMKQANFLPTVAVKKGMKADMGMKRENFFHTAAMKKEMKQAHFLPAAVKKSMKAMTGMKAARMRATYQAIFPD